MHTHTHVYVYTLARALIYSLCAPLALVREHQESSELHAVCYQECSVSL